MDFRSLEDHGWVACGHGHFGTVADSVNQSQLLTSLPAVSGACEHSCLVHTAGLRPALHATPTCSRGALECGQCG